MFLTSVSLLMISLLNRDTAGSKLRNSPVADVWLELVTELCFYSFSPALLFRNELPFNLYYWWTVFF